MSTQNARSLAILLLALFLASCAPTAPQPPPAIATPSSPPATSTVTQSPPSSPTSMPTPTLAPGQTRTDPSGIQQVWVPAGSFQMGSGAATIQGLQALSPPAWVRREFASEQPQHEVRLTKGYWIDKYEVTNRAFQAFVDAGGYTRQDDWSEAGWQWLSRQNVGSLPKSCQGDAPDLPRLCATWYEAEAYARWRGGRLPTEAEWEFAARGPQALRYPWGNVFDSRLCNVVDSDGPVAVGSYPAGASWVGALDMAGNAMEWVQDWLDVNYYKQGVSEDPTGPASGRIKIEKGGWWGSNLFVARAAYRHFEDPPEYGDKHIGFRIVSPIQVIEDNE